MKKNNKGKIMKHVYILEQTTYCKFNPIKMKYIRGAYSTLNRALDAIKLYGGDHNKKVIKEEISNNNEGISLILEDNDDVAYFTVYKRTINEKW